MSGLPNISQTQKSTLKVHSFHYIGLVSNSSKAMHLQSNTASIVYSERAA